MEVSEIIDDDIQLEKAEEINAFGSTSHTYKVRIKGKLYFMKQLRLELTKDLRYKQMFIKEFETGKSIDHPCFVRYHSLSNDGNGLYILMDYVNGYNLEELLNSEPTFFSKRASIYKLVRQILEAL